MGRPNYLPYKASLEAGIVTGETSYVVRGFDLGQPIGILCFHGMAGSGFIVSTTPLGPYVSWLAQYGGLLHSSDMAGNGWGNQATRDKATEVYNWLVGAGGARTGKVMLLAQSAGAPNALRWWKDNPEKVGSCVLLVPALNLDNVFADNAALQSSMNSAWSGSYATNGATFSPHVYAEDLADTAPCEIWYADDDEMMRAADVVSVADALNASTADIGPGGHAALENFSDIADPSHLITMLKTA